MGFKCKKVKTSLYEDGKMRYVILNTKRSPFVKSVLVLASGTALAQVISIISSPIITRIYGPEAYGIMGIFIAIVNIVTPIATLTYPIAIVLPKKEDEAKQIIKLSLFITIAVTLFVTLLILIFSDLMVGLLGIDKLGPYLMFIPLAIIAGGFLQVEEQWQIRNRQFKINAKASVVQSLIIQGGKVGVGLFNPSVLILILFSAITQGIKGLFMEIMSKKEMKIINKKLFKVNRLSLVETFKSYKDFPLYRAPQVFIDSITQNIPTLLLSIFFGPVSAGFYTLSRTTLSAPISLISKAVGDVFYPHITKASYDGQDIRKILMKTTILLTLIAIIPFGILFLFSPSIFGFLFGEEWTNAGFYAGWLAIWSFSTFILQPSLKVLPVINAQELHLKITIISLIIRIIALFIGGFYFSNELLTIALFAIVSFILNILLIFLTVHKASKFQQSLIVK